METLQVTKENALAAYKKADPIHKVLIEDLFGKQHFIGSMADWEAYIIFRINSFEDACREKGIDPRDDKYNLGDPDDIAYQRGKVVCDVLNGPFLPLMKDMTSRKHYAWMDKTEAGFRFIVTDFGITHSFTTGGSRLRLCSEKIAKHFAITFTDMMAAFWW